MIPYATGIEKLMLCGSLKKNVVYTDWNAATPHTAATRYCTRLVHITNTLTISRGMAAPRK